MGKNARRAAAVLGALAFAAPLAAASETLDEGVQSAVAPAYRFVEAVSDGVYDFVRVHVVGAVLPGRFSRNLISAPRQDSSELFGRVLREKQTALLQRLRETYPAASAQGAAVDPRRLQEWRTRAFEEQQGVALDALADTLTRRYQIRTLGRASETYVKDRRNWDAGTLAMSGIVGGAILYVSGLHTTVSAGRARMRLDMRPGQRLQRALTSGGTTAALGGVEVSYRGVPVTAAFEWGVRGGRLSGDTAGLKYVLRY